jgi:uncharacterized protein YcgL (UPF0745 family)
MQCVIYKGHKKPDSYLFIEREDDFTRVPETLLSMVGNLEYVMTLELQQQLQLARVSAGEVMHHITDQGYYLQLPPTDHLNLHKTEMKP